MISGILEITACTVAATFGMVGFFTGTSPHIVAVSGALVVLVVVYLSQLAELMQNPHKTNIRVCKVLNKLIYATIVAQVITAALL